MKSLRKRAIAKAQQRLNRKKSKIKLHYGFDMGFAATKLSHMNRADAYVD